MNETTSTEITFIHSPDMTEMATVITGENPMPLLRLTRRLDVKRQEVVSGPTESADRCGATDTVVRAMPVVVMCPAIQHRGALRGVLVRNAVRPFAQG